MLEHEKIMVSIGVSSKLFDEYLGIVGNYKKKFIIKHSEDEDWQTAYITREDKNGNEYFLYYDCSKVNIAKHFVNEHGFAIGLRGKGDVTHFDVDIDSGCPYVANEIIDYFAKFTNKENILWCTRKASGHMSVIGRCSPVDVDVMNKQLTKIVENEIGLEVFPGQIELFPNSLTGRRLPFGAGQHVNSIPFLKTKSEQLERFINATPVNLAEVAKGIKSKKRKKKKQNKTYELTVQKLLRVGLVEPGTRYKAERTLRVYFREQGYSEGETYSEISKWLHSKTNNFSNEWQKDKGRVLHNLKNDCRTFYAWFEKHGKGISIKRSEKLSHGDVRYIFEMAGEDIRFGEWLYDLFLFVKNRGVYDDNLFLPATKMKKFKNGGHNYVEYRERAIKARFLSLKGNYSVGSHSNVFKVNYEFKNDKLFLKNISYREALKKTQF